LPRRLRSGFSEEARDWIAAFTKARSWNGAKQSGAEIRSLIWHRGQLEEVAAWAALKPLPQR
jgi:hypothetical protein